MRRQYGLLGGSRGQEPGRHACVGRRQAEVWPQQQQQRRRKPGHSVCVRGWVRMCLLQHELLDGSRRQEPGYGVDVKGEGPARSACVVIEVQIRLRRVRGETRDRRPHKPLGGSRRQEPCHGVDVRSEMQTRCPLELADGSQLQEPGHSTCVRRRQRRASDRSSSSPCRNRASAPNRGRGGRRRRGKQLRTRIVAIGSVFGAREWRILRWLGS